VIVDLLLDPDKALDAVNKAVALVKKASKTVDNVESLGPVLGKYFDAKANAIASAQKAKAGGFGASAMGKAIEITMLIESQRQFEEELKMLFFQSNKMDLWVQIKARATEMERDAAKFAASEKRASAARKKKEQEDVELVLVAFFAIVLLGASSYAAYEFLKHCSEAGCG
jgi:hypothetical protein